MNKLLFIAPLIAIVAGVSVLSTERAYADAGGDAGNYYARLDFENNVGYHGSCSDHGIDVVNNQDYCLSFKLAYAGEWAILTVAK